ncbi:MAG TPA: alanine/glycine:cation symporter family protein, partial [Pirellulales bacterium]|nr:alanine/glycine:cation symporter family protein [Pirellulales bacterium]
RSVDVFVSDYLSPVLFYGIPTGLSQEVMDDAGKMIETPVKIPLILLTLVSGGFIFTFLHGFINLRLFGHSLQVIRGRFDHPDDEGEITHFQALTSALSATVGLGNIAGVAVAIATGGPGAVFWMWVIAFFGMSMKFSSCSFAQLYRRVKPDGTVLGGPMIYLDEGIKEHLPSLAWLGKAFGVVFAVFTMFAAFGGGNMFQGNQSFSIISQQFKWPQEYAWLFGVILAILVGLVIIGGIRRIGEVTSKLVPAMCGFYCICCLIIILNNVQEVPTMFVDIFRSAFTLKAGVGGLVGVLLIGAKRAAFSNEAGLGSAAIAHAAAKTKEPIREGVVAMIGPFIDTIVVCTMTALTILITKSHLQPGEGIELTTRSFATLGDWAPYLLCIAVFVFAYSTMISWSYYGERATEYLLGLAWVVPYRCLYVLMVVLGPILSLQAVVDFSDMMLLSMAFPNILGMLLLTKVIRPKVKDYVARLRSGEMKPVK